MWRANLLCFDQFFKDAFVWLKPGIWLQCRDIARGILVGNNGCFNALAFLAIRVIIVIILGSSACV
jgi:hypothetical protein